MLLHGGAGVISGQSTTASRQLDNAIFTPIDAFHWAALQRWMYNASDAAMSNATYVQPSPPPLPPSPAAQTLTCSAAEEGSTRLVGIGAAAVNSPQGRLEICHAGQWGTFCVSRIYNLFGLPEAKVACRQLGFSGVNARFVMANAYFGQAAASQPLWLTRVACYGNETSLMDCSRSMWGALAFCTHQFDVGLVCDGADYVRSSNAADCE